MFTIRTKRKALKNLEKLSPNQKQIIKATILILKNDPIPFKKADICKLKGYENIYRIRIGTQRIVYEILWNQKEILIHYVGPRKKAYD
jgi:mRNA interferase RelE/StbE